MKKNFFWISAIALGACVAALGQTSPGGAAAAPPKAAAPAVAPTRIAVINVQQAIVNTQEGQKAAAEMQSRFNPRKATLEKRQTEIQGLQDQLRKGGSTMSDAAKDKIMREIDSSNKSLQRDADDLNSDVEQENNKLMQELGTKLMAVMDQYAAQNGYAVVLDVSNQQSPVFWADASSVITADIVKLYDQAHPAAGAAKTAPAGRPPAAPAAKGNAPAAPKTNPAPPAAKKQ